MTNRVKRYSCTSALADHVFCLIPNQHAVSSLGAAVARTRSYLHRRQGLIQSQDRYRPYSLRLKLPMSRQTNKEVENYWAARLLETGFLAELFRATQLECIDPEQHGDPPDAMYEGLDAHGDRLQLWVEISGAWRSPAGAKETFEVAEGRKPAPTGPRGLLAGPDEATAKSVARAVCSKLQKDSYLDLADNCGPGHLHVFVSSDHYPLFEVGTLAEIRRHLAMIPLNSQSVFRSVSVGWHGQTYLVWNKSGMPAAARQVILSGSRRRQVWLREGRRFTAIPGELHDVPLLAVGIAAARETLLAATPHMASIWTDLLASFLLEGDSKLLWRDDGPGIGRDARISYSSLMGRYSARAYLTEEQGVQTLVPLEVAKRSLRGTRFAITKRSSRGLQADWIGLDRHGLVIAEAKGSFDPRIGAWCGPNALPPTVETAINQAERTVLINRDSGCQLRAKRWAVASRWGTENNEREPTMIAVRDLGESHQDENCGAVAEDYQELAEVLLRADSELVKDGLTVSTVGGSEASLDSPVPLRIGELTLDPSYSAALGPFGQQPLRNQDDLKMVRESLKTGAPVALVSFSDSYYRDVMYGRWPFLRVFDDKSWPIDDSILRRRSQVSESARSLVIERNGLTVSWLDRDQDIDLML